MREAQYQSVKRTMSEVFVQQWTEIASKQLLMVMGICKSTDKPVAALLVLFDAYEFNFKPSVKSIEITAL